jgi:hypothetical protein
MTLQNKISLFNDIYGHVLSKFEVKADANLRINVLKRPV